MLPELSPADQQRIDALSDKHVAAFKRTRKKWNAARKRLDFFAVMERNTQALNRNTAELERLSREGGDHD